MAGMRDVVPSTRPNWTFGQSPASASPGTDLVAGRQNWTPGAPQQPVDFDMGPGNSRVGPNGSSQAQDFRAQQPAALQPGAAPTATATAAPAEPAATGWRGAWRSLRAGANSVGDAAVTGGKSAGGGLMRSGLAVLPAATGYGTGVLQQRMDAAEPSPEPFVAPASAPGQIPVEPGMRSPEHVEQHPLGFGPDNAFTRNAANTVNAVTGLGRGLGAGVGALSGFIRNGSAAMRGVVGAERATQVAVPFVQGAQAAGSAESTSAVPTTDPASMRGPSDPSIGPPPPTNPAGTIIRDGNSYSGTGNIKFGADIRNPDNSMRNGGDALSKGFGVSSLDFSEGRRQDALELQRLHSAPGLPQSVTTGDGGSTLGQGATGFGGNFSTGLRGRKADRANTAAMASMREQGENLRSQRQTDAMMRGQDVAREGHMLTNDAARIRLGYDMKKGERDFAAGRDDANFTQGQAAQKDIHSTIANMLPPIMVDGKPTADMAGAARHMEALSTHVSDRMGNLRQHLKLNPGDKQAASELAGLQARGVAMLPPDQVNKVVRGRMAADVATAAHTGMFNPFGGTAVNSNAPITSMRDDGNGNYVSDRGDVTPHRYFDKTDSILGFGGKRNLDFDTLKTMRSAR